MVAAASVASSLQECGVEGNNGFHLDNTDSFQSPDIGQQSAANNLPVRPNPVAIPPTVSVGILSFKFMCEEKYLDEIFISMYLEKII